MSPEEYVLERTRPWGSQLSAVCSQRPAAGGTSASADCHVHYKCCCLWGVYLRMKMLSIALWTRSLCHHSSCENGKSQATIFRGILLLFKELVRDYSFPRPFPISHSSFQCPSLLDFSVLMFRVLLYICACMCESDFPTWALNLEAMSCSNLCVLEPGSAARDSQ